jgi:hypothetical protein
MATVQYVLGGVCCESELMPLPDAQAVAASLRAALKDVVIVEIKMDLTIRRDEESGLYSVGDSYPDANFTAREATQLVEILKAFPDAQWGFCAHVLDLCPEFTKAETLSSGLGVFADLPALDIPA